MAKSKDYKTLVVTVKMPVHTAVTKKARELYGKRKRSFHVNKVLEEHGQ